MLLSPIICEPLGVIGRCYLPCGYNMVDVFAIVADGIATFFDVFIVADGKATSESPLPYSWPQ